MKQVSNDLNEYLNNERNFVAVDLYLLKLKSGNTYYLTDFDADVVWNGITWQHKLLLIKRDLLSLNGEPSVDTLTVNINCSNNDKIDGVPFMYACHNGLLDDGVMALYKAYFKDGVCVGAYKIFEGLTEVNSAGGIGVKLSIKSIVQGLSQNIPPRVFAPQSAYCNDNGTVTTSDKDEYTMLIPLKPSMRVLVKL